MFWKRVQIAIDRGTEGLKRRKIKEKTIKTPR
jgi:hypothetical protein